MATTTDAATEFLDGLVGAEAKATAEAEATVKSLAKIVATDRSVDPQKLTAALKATGRTVSDFAAIVRGHKKDLAEVADLAKLPAMNANYSRHDAREAELKAKIEAQAEENDRAARDIRRERVADAEAISRLEGIKAARIAACTDELLVCKRQATEDQLHALSAEKKHIEVQLLRDRTVAAGEPVAGMMYKPEDVELARSRTEANKARLIEIRVEHDRVGPALEAIDNAMALALE